MGLHAAFMAACDAALTIDPGAWGATQLAEGKGLLGYVELHPERARLEHLFVAPEAQGRGVGRALWEWALERARAEGLAQLALDADPHSERFYARLGA